ncbi:hypothetical protein OH77DRAFT_393683 [Trametes cingulata]|nr:hypothetical protein OH77DRAFT_393683 [Trametes cingulata]
MGPSLHLCRTQEGDEQNDVSSSCTPSRCISHRQTSYDRLSQVSAHPNTCEGRHMRMQVPRLSSVEATGHVRGPQTASERPATTLERDPLREGTRRRPWGGLCGRTRDGTRLALSNSRGEEGRLPGSGATLLSLAPRPMLVLPSLRSLLRAWDLLLRQRDRQRR